jgi:hypothetical protein
MLLLLATARGQEAGLGVFDQVPFATRSNLKHQLNKYIEYEREQKYAEVYGLLADSYIDHLNRLGVNNKAAYVRHRRSASVIINFKPLSISVSDGPAAKTYYIDGMVRSRWGSRIYDERGSLNAYLKNGRWYFSDIGIEISNEQP